MTLDSSILYSVSFMLETNGNTAALVNTRYDLYELCCRARIYTRSGRRHNSRVLKHDRIRNVRLERGERTQARELRARTHTRTHSVCNEEKETDGTRDKEGQRATERTERAKPEEGDTLAPGQPGPHAHCTLLGQRSSQSPGQEARCLLRSRQQVRG